MNFKYRYSLVFFFLAFNLSFSQENNTVGSIMLYDRHPVDLYTGTPQISIPLYSMPTRLKNLPLNVSFNYHPSTISKYNNKMYNAGKGWSYRMPTGVISRQGSYMVDELRWSSGNLYSIYPNNVFEFNVFGLSGEFTLHKEGNNVEVIIIRNIGEKLEIDVEYDSLTNTIEAFRIYDNHGYIYDFKVVDTYQYIGPDEEDMNINSSFQLSSIKDNNLQEIASFEYLNRTYNFQDIDYSYNFLSKIISNGFGKIEFDVFVPAVMTNDFRIAYRKMEVFDAFNNKVLQVKYDDAENKLVKSLNEVNLENTVESQTYEFKYHKPAIMLNEEDDSFDIWGYPKRKCSDLYPGHTADLGYVTNGVLQQIIYPSGGSVVYEFESNSFSFKGNKNPMDHADPAYYVNPNFPENLVHNYSRDILTNALFSPYNQSEKTFVVTETAEYYFKHHVNMNYIPPFWDDYPGFSLMDNSLNVIASIYSLDNDLNSCLGKKITLTPGTYKVSFNHAHLTTANIKIYNLIQNTNVKKYWNGGGIRIKRIGYFNQQVPNNYYNLPSPSPIEPVREINYTYNFFDDVNTSSGYTLFSYNPYSEEYKGIALVTYKNVTVTENNQGTGKIQYTYFSPLDEDSFWEDPRNGAILKEAAFNNQNQLVKETEYEYDVIDLIDNSVYNENTLLEIVVFPEFNLKMGWITPSSIIEKLYAGSTDLEQTQSYTYSPIQKNITKSINSTSISGVLESKEYSYHSLNSVHSKNRQEIELIESYLGSNLIHTSKVIYSNTWPVLAEDSGVGNESYLPQRTESSKNGTDFKVLSKVNLYDKYSNIIEYENEQGTKIVNIWGYNKTQIVAKIENISYSQIPQYLITAIQNASNTSNENSLLTALNSLRVHSSLANALVTTYTYKPLIGVSTQIDYRGRKISYYYDDFGRLMQVRDHDNNILTEKEYYNQWQN